MRPAGRDETDSLYFTYPHFNEPRGEARAHLGDAVPVVIVGAGPVGMVAALSLAREGIRSVLVEARSSFNDGSRAICIARQSFHILESLGALEPFLAKALGWTTGRSFYRGRQILEFMNAGRAIGKIPADVQSPAAIHREVSLSGHRRQSADRDQVAK
jgi:3-(3-hydroxy-phenyl)propionate hydroxylase